MKNHSLTKLLLISNFHHIFKLFLDIYGRCRWTTNADEPLLFVKYDINLLNILDVEKKTLTLKMAVKVTNRAGNNRKL